MDNEEMLSCWIDECLSNEEKQMIKEWTLETLFGEEQNDRRKIATDS